MAVVATNIIEGGNVDLYEKIIGRVMPGDQLPEGCQLHLAGPVEQGWRVITVWDSEEVMERFREETLLPAFREIAGEQGPRPRPEVSAVHKLVTA